MIGSPEILGLTLLVAGMTVRITTVLDDAHRLKMVDDPGRGDGLRGTYVLSRLGAALMALGGAVFASGLLGDAGFAVALFAAPPLLVLSDLLPRALARQPQEKILGAWWTAALGRGLRALERPWTGTNEYAWTHDGLTTLVRTDAPGEDAAEQHMARRVYDFGDVSVGDIMVPLVDVIAVRDDSSADEVVRVAKQEGFSRIPVFHERLPNVIGLIHVFDLLVQSGARSAAELMKTPTFVPEMTPASDVLRRLQVEGVNLAVVVDEYGGAVGIVAIEDILEEVVGEIEDEYDEEEDPVCEVEAGAWIVDGRAEIERLNERFPWQLPEGEYETLGGLMLAHLAHIPDVGETLALPRVALRVTAASPRSVDEISVTTIAEPNEEGRT
ncbi:MAG: transporter associated domain-containing protein [Candidatus Binatia bacterium]|nr:transporter associated domain-containing protein [Candidatus Binatia bacterium]